MPQKMPFIISERQFLLVVLFLSMFSFALAVAANFSAQYPIAELGNCENDAACGEYCSNIEKIAYVTEKCRNSKKDYYINIDVQGAFGYNQMRKIQKHAKAKYKNQNKRRLKAHYA